MQLYHQIIHYDLERTYYKMSISEKIKAIDKKIKQNKAQYDLDRQNAKIDWQRCFARKRLARKNC